MGSVKSAPLRQVAARVDAATLRRYVGSHPMAGSERSGPFAASGALFDGRPWAVVPHPGADPGAVSLVTELARLCGATPVTLSPAEHDLAVARTSHLPHLVAALMAGRLTEAPADHLALSGQGVRDVTRVAAGDPGLWQQIISANADAVAELLGDVRDDLDRLLTAVTEGERGSLGELLERGRAGTAAIPGKHGGPAQVLGELYVAVPDHPGELARLFADAERDRREHRGRAHRPRPRPAGRCGRARRRRGPRRPAPGVARGPGLDHAPVGFARQFSQEGRDLGR